MQLRSRAQPVRTVVLNRHHGTAEFFLTLTSLGTILGFVPKFLHILSALCWVVIYEPQLKIREHSISI